MKRINKSSQLKRGYWYKITDNRKDTDCIATFIIIKNRRYYFNVYKIGNKLTRDSLEGYIMERDMHKLKNKTKVYELTNQEKYLELL